MQVVFEILIEFGLHAFVEPFRRPPNPWFAGTGYAIFGVIAGGLSLWAFPALFIQAKSMQLVNLALTPVLAGIAMTAIGAWRLRRNQSLIRLDRFAYGYLFALSMALVRFALAR
nr:hypothetical protein [Collimonas pratensis]